jgi:transposase
MMTAKRRTYGDECERGAVRLVTEHGYGISETARHLGSNATILGCWKRACTAKQSAAFPGNGRVSPAQDALHRFHDENKRLRMERDILKKALASLPTHRPEVCLYGRAAGPSASREAL